MEEVERKVEQAARERPVIDADAGLVEVPSTRTRWERN